MGVFSSAPTYHTPPKKKKIKKVDFRNPSVRLAMQKKQLLALAMENARLRKLVECIPELERQLALARAEADDYWNELGKLQQQSASTPRKRTRSVRRSL